MADSANERMTFVMNLSMSVRDGLVTRSFPFRETVTCWVSVRVRVRARVRVREVYEDEGVEKEVEVEVDIEIDVGIDIDSKLA